MWKGKADYGGIVHMHMCGEKCHRGHDALPGLLQEGDGGQLIPSEQKGDKMKIKVIQTLTGETKEGAEIHCLPNGITLPDAETYIVSAGERGEYVFESSLLDIARAGKRTASMLRAKYPNILAFSLAEGAPLSTAYIIPEGNGDTHMSLYSHPDYRGAEYGGYGNGPRNDGYRGLIPVTTKVWGNLPTPIYL